MLTLTLLQHDADFSMLNSGGRGGLVEWELGAFQNFQVNCDCKCNKYRILVHGLKDLGGAIKFIRDEISFALFQVLLCL